MDREKGMGALFAAMVLFAIIFILSFLVTRSWEYAVIITAVLLIAFLIVFRKIGIIKFY